MTRRFLFLSIVSLALVSSQASAQDVAPPSVENARVAFEGAVKGDNVMVRCGPGENYYPTSKLNKGDTVTVVGSVTEWLKIVPPQGSFCYVAKAYVERRGIGSTGRIVKDDVNVRAGSSLVTQKYIPVGKVNKEEDVTILGEQDEYFKIAPPKSAYLFVKKEFVIPVKPLEPNPGQVAVAPAPTPGAGNGGEPESGNRILAAAGGSTTNPTTEPAHVEATNVVPTTQEADAAALEFDRLETAFKTIEEKPLEQQPLTETLVAYEKVVADRQLPASMRRIAEGRIAYLRDRADAQQKLLDVHKAQQDAEARRKALKAEEQELIERQKTTGVTVYSAVGALQTSSLQIGAETLYRLTDPANGRTICYVRTNDAKTVGLLNQFVGVNGDVASEAQLPMKVVTARQIVAVDPAKVTKGVIAQIMPPSILTAGGQASTTDNP